MRSWLLSSFLYYVFIHPLTSPYCFLAVIYIKITTNTCLYLISYFQFRHFYWFSIFKIHFGIGWEASWRWWWSTWFFGSCGCCGSSCCPVWYCFTSSTTWKLSIITGSSTVATCTIHRCKIAASGMILVGAASSYTIFLWTYRFFLKVSVQLSQWVINQ